MQHASSNIKPEQATWLDLVARRVQSLRFGSVQITVHDGKVVQIDQTERLRLHANGALAAQAETT